MANFNLRNAVLKIKDNGANNITVKIGDGNLTYSEKVTREFLMDRGHIDSVRKGDDVPLEVNFDFRWEFIKADTGEDITVEDALKKRGLASAWVTTDSDTCRPYSVDLEFTFTPICTTEDKEVILFPDFRYESLDHDAKAGTVACAGKCNATEPTVTRVAQA